MRPPIHRPTRLPQPAARKTASEAFYVSPAWRKVRAFVLARDNHTCRLVLPGCWTTADIADHVIARSEGGSDDPANLRAVCRGCHNRRHKSKL
jgi:5-methylcytosine-specific restriction protein A